MEYKFHRVTTTTSIKGAALVPVGMLFPQKQRAILREAIEKKSPDQRATVNSLGFTTGV